MQQLSRREFVQLTAAGVAVAVPGVGLLAPARATAPPPEPSSRRLVLDEPARPRWRPSGELPDWWDDMLQEVGFGFYAQAFFSVCEEAERCRDFMGQSIEDIVPRPILLPQRRGERSWCYSVVDKTDEVDLRAPIVAALEKVGKAWGHPVHHVLEAMDIDDRFATERAVYYLLMGCEGHGVCLADDHADELDLAGERLGTVFDDAPCVIDLEWEYYDTAFQRAHIWLNEQLKTPENWAQRTSIDWASGPDRTHVVVLELFHLLDDPEQEAFRIWDASDGELGGQPGVLLFEDYIDVADLRIGREDEDTFTAALAVGLDTPCYHKSHCRTYKQVQQHWLETEHAQKLITSCGLTVPVSPYVVDA